MNTYKPLSLSYYLTFSSDSILLFEQPNFMLGRKPVLLTVGDCFDKLMFEIIVFELGKTKYKGESYE
jgi:hypothetical protein